MKSNSLSFAFSILFYGCSFTSFSNALLHENDDNDAYLTSLQILEKYGYPAEAYVVTTEDDYILQLHRIPHGKDPKMARRGIPILIHHGFLGSSADFLLLGPEKGLAFLLADSGYDVWLANVRGNTYSRAHKTLTPHDRKFWDFSWHEPALYDLTAQIDFICKFTQNDDLLYVGYSMGTTMLFTLASSRPEYQQKIRGAFLLSAVAYFKNARTPFRVLAPFANDIQVLSEILTDGELAQQSTLYRFLMKYACTATNVERDICRNLIFLFTGIDPYQFNKALLPSILYHLPAGGSAKTLTHYAQLIESGKFCQFDYGHKENAMRYNSSTPPEYNLEAITIPLYLFEGKNDFLSTEKDIQLLLQRLRNKVSLYVVDYPHFNHLDFFLANDAKTLLYDKVMEKIEDFLTT